MRRQKFAFRKTGRYRNHEGFLLWRSSNERSLTGNWQQAWKAGKAVIKRQVAAGGRAPLPACGFGGSSSSFDEAPVSLFGKTIQPSFSRPGAPIRSHRCMPPSQPSARGFHGKINPALLTESSVGRDRSTQLVVRVATTVRSCSRWQIYILQLMR